MAQISNAQVKHTYSEAYFEAVKYFVMHSQTHDMSRKEIHRQASMAASYKTYLVTGKYLKKMNFSKSQRHNIYQAIGRGIKNRSLTNTLKTLIETGSPEFGPVSNMLASAMMRDLRKTLDPSIREGLLKKLGLDVNETHGLMKINEVMDKLGLDHAGTPNEHLNAKFIHDNKRGWQAVFEHDPNNPMTTHVDEHGKLILDPRIQEAEGYVAKLRMASGDLPLDEMHHGPVHHEPTARVANFTTTHMEPQLEYEFISHILDHYEKDDYLSHGTIETAFGLHVEHRKIRPEGFGRNLQLYDPEIELLAKMAQHNGANYLHPVATHPAFYNIFRDNFDEFHRKSVAAVSIQDSGEMMRYRQQIGEQFRADLITAHEVASNYLNQVRRDRGHLNTIKRVLQVAKKTKSDIGSVLQTAQFKDTDIAAHVLTGLDAEGIKNPMAVLNSIASFIRKDLFIPLPLLESNYMGTHIEEGTGQRVMHAAPDRLLTEINVKLRNIDNPDERQFYGTANLYRDFLKDYRGVQSNMRERHREISIGYQEYAKFGDVKGRDDIKTDLMDAEEKEALYRFTTKDIKEDDFREQVAKEGRELAAEERMSSGRTRIRNHILSTMEQENGQGLRMKNAILHVIEQNAATLTTHAVNGDTEAADKAFAAKLFTQIGMLNRNNNPLRGLTRDGLDAIIHGWQIDRTNPMATRARVAEIEAQNHKPLTSVMESKAQTEQTRMAEWRSAAHNGDWIAVPGRSGRHQIIGLSGTEIHMRAEHITPTNMTAHMNISHDDIMNLLSDVNLIRMNEIEGRKFLYNETQRTIQNSFVELRYQHELVNEDMKINNKKTYERIMQLDKHMLIKTPEEVGGIHSVVVPLRNLLEPYNVFMSRTQDGTIDSAVSRMPNFMKELINTKLPYMRQLGKGDELASMAYMALADAVFSLHEERSIDLSDAGFKQRWILGGKTNEQAEELLAGLNLSGRKDRLDAFLEQRVQNQMYHQFYNSFNEGEQRKAGESVVHDVLEQLQRQFASSGHKDKELEPTAANVRSFIHKIADDLNIQPFYNEATKFTEPQIAMMIQDHQLGNKRVSYEDWVEKLNNAHEQEFEREMLSLDSKLADKVIDAHEHQQSQAYLQQMYELRQASKGMTPQDINDVMAMNPVALKQQFQNLHVDSHNQLEFVYNAMMTHDPHAAGLEMTIPFEGKDYRANVVRKSGGEFSAYIPALSREIPIFRDASQADERYQMHQFAPKRAYSGQIVKDLTESGGVRRSHIGDYDTIQRKGASYLTHADPSDTVDNVRKLIAGEHKAVYFDMETTGLTGSTIPEHLIQPLEVFYQRGQWDAATNDFHRVGGQVGVQTENGIEQQIAHYFVQPTEDVVAFARSIAKKRSAFAFKVAGENYNVIDVLNMRSSKNPTALSDFRKRVSAQPNGEVINRNIDEMVDRLYFLRNLAKYSGNEATFENHVGMNDAALDPAKLNQHLTELFQDVGAALKNFKINPKTGDLHLADKMPEFADAEVITKQQLVERHHAFVGDDIVMGQNVAEADIAKITALSQQSVAAERANLLAQRQAVMQSDVQSFMDKYDPIYTDSTGRRRVRGGLKLQGSKDRYYQQVSVPKKVYDAQMVSSPFEDHNINFGMNLVKFGDPKNSNRTYALLTQDQINNVWENNKQKDLIAFTDLFDEDVMKTVKMADKSVEVNGAQDAILRIAKHYFNNDLQQMAPYIDHSEVATRDGLKAWETMYAIPLDSGIQRSGERTVYEHEWQKLSSKTIAAMDPAELQRLVNEKKIIIEPGMSQDERVGQAMEHYEAMPYNVKKKRTIEGKPILDYYNEMSLEHDMLKGVSEMTDDQFLEHARAMGKLDFTALDAATAAHESLAKPKVIEEMFLAGLTMPELPNRKAETIQAALGMGKAAGQHFAATDVNVGMDASARMIQRLSNMPEFKDYDGGLLQAGDFVEHHQAVDRTLPLGVYQVNEVGENHIKMTEFGTGAEHTMYAENPVDLNRKFQLHFDFVGTQQHEAQAVYNEFAEDQARRHISRATESAFHYDLAEGKATGQSDVALRRLETYREGMTGRDGSGMQAILTPKGRMDLAEAVVPEHARAEVSRAMDDVALDKYNEDLLDRDNFDILATPTETPASHAAKPAVNEFLKSDEAKARKAFMHEVRAMETFDIIPKSVGADLLRQMNASIIEEGKRRGFTRTQGSVVHAGVMDKTFAGLEGTPMALDISSSRRLNQSLYSIAQKLMPQGQEMISNPDGLFITEGNMKGSAMNNIIFPFLKKQGILDYDTSITLPEAIRQIRSREVVLPHETAGVGQLQQFNAYDYLAHDKASENEEFMAFIKQKHEELLAPYRQAISPVQQDLMEKQAQVIEMLQEHGLYDANMRIKPEIDTAEFTPRTISINNLQGLGQYDTTRLESRLNEIKESGIVEDVDLRRGIMNELFKRATTGRPDSVEGLIGENLHDADRMESARILGYVTGNMQDGYQPSTDIGNMYLGTTYPSSRGDRYRFADSQIADLPKEVIEKMRQGVYTEGNGDSFVANLLDRYARSNEGGMNYEGHRGPDSIPKESIQNTYHLTDEQLADAGVKDVPSHLAEMVKLRKEQGDEAARRKSVYIQEQMDKNRERPQGAIEEFLSDAKNTIKETSESIFGEGGAMGPGVRKAAKWIGGIGIAAYALKQFASAGGPLKFEHRPQGQGVEGIAGGGDNDDMNRNEQLQAGNDPTATGKSYVTTGGGYQIKARAKNTRGIAHEDVTKKLQSDIGDFNVNLNDDRTTMDRQWLNGQMDQYVNRGYLG